MLWSQFDLPAAQFKIISASSSWCIHGLSRNTNQAYCCKALPIVTFRSRIHFNFTFFGCTFSCKAKVDWRREKHPVVINYSHSQDKIIPKGKNLVNKLHSAFNLRINMQLIILHHHLLSMSIKQVTYNLFCPVDLKIFPTDNWFTDFPMIVLVRTPYPYLNTHQEPIADWTITQLSRPGYTQVDLAIITSHYQNRLPYCFTGSYSFLILIKWQQKLAQATIINALKLTFTITATARTTAAAADLCPFLLMQSVA